MKKLFLFLIAFFSIAVVLPSAVFAIDLGGDLVGEAAVRGGYSGRTNETTLAETVGQVIKAVLSLVGIIFTALMVYAGFLWMTARGDEGMVEKSKHVLSAAIIGLIITLGSYSITAFILPRVLEKTTGDAGADPGLGGPEAPCCEVCLINSGLDAEDACRRSIIFSSDRETDTQACQNLCRFDDQSSCNYLGKIPRGQCN